MTRTRRLTTMWLTAVLLPATAGAQTVATSFDELAKILSVGQVVTVTESDGRQTKGTFTGIASGFLTIEKGSTNRTFAQATVTSVSRRDSPIEGLLIGAGAGAVAGAVFLNANCGSGDAECAAIAGPVGFLTMIPGGAVAGFLIDKTPAATASIARRA